MTSITGVKAGGPVSIRLYRLELAVWIRLDGVLKALPDSFDKNLAGS